MGLDVTDRAYLGRIASDLQARSKTLVEMADAGRFYFSDEVVYDEAAAQKFLKPDVAEHLRALLQRLPELSDFSREGIERFLITFVEERQIKFKTIAQPLRVALTGKTVSPGIDEMMVTMGRERITGRIQRAVAYIAGDLL
jgi:glutamyl-tRNA synthetase